MYVLCLYGTSPDCCVFPLLGRCDWAGRHRTGNSLSLSLYLNIKGFNFSFLLHKEVILKLVLLSFMKNKRFQKIIACFNTSSLACWRLQNPIALHTTSLLAKPAMMRRIKLKSRPVMETQTQCSKRTIRFSLMKTCITKELSQH